jgi:hypothetical protein
MKKFSCHQSEISEYIPPIKWDFRELGGKRYSREDSEKSSLSEIRIIKKNQHRKNRQVDRKIVHVSRVEL